MLDDPRHLNNCKLNEIFFCNQDIQKQYIFLKFIVRKKKGLRVGCGIDPGICCGVEPEGGKLMARGQRPHSFSGPGGAGVSPAAASRPLMAVSPVV